MQNQRVGRSLTNLSIAFFLPVHLFMALPEIKDNLQCHVLALAEEIGARNLSFYGNLEKAAQYIEKEFTDMGYPVMKQTYQVEGKSTANLIAQKNGSANTDEIIVVGAHYDTILSSPGADDNASGVAGLLELARLWKEEAGKKTVRFVAFTLEEPPFYKTDRMGSRVYAKSVKNENITAMICLEMLGYYTNKDKSQEYPLSFMKAIYPPIGNFIAVVGNFSSRSLVKRVEKTFKKSTSTPVESISAFEFVTGVDFSDHASFWDEGFPAVMITDTAFYRNPHYHAESDLPDTLDYSTFAQTVWGLYHTLFALDNNSTK
jgi:Zn-dependent M28 family amino/carboxypeptidase